MMIPERYREQLPPYWYENEVAEYHFTAMGEETDCQMEKIRELGRQFLLPYATYGLDVWDWIFFGDTQIGTIEQRRADIRKKNFAKARFTLETLRAIGQMGGKLEKITENFANKEIWFEFSDAPVNLAQLSQDFERIRPVHVKRCQAVVNTRGERIVVSTAARFFEVEYPLCGLFYPEDDLEGRIYRESLTVGEAARTHTVDYPLANAFYPVSEQEV
jgi:hypothetical protein